MLAPFLLDARRLVQGLFRENQLWDDIVTSAEVVTWSQWYSALPVLESVTLPRCFILCLSLCRVELHACSDASKDSLACVVYLHAIKGERIRTSFLLGKSCVCPKKKVSIPRLELMAAEMSVVIVAIGTRH